jgi:cysteinyl-tRNA synthetase
LLDSNQPLSVGTLAAVDGLFRELGGQVLGIIPDDLTQDVGSELIDGLMAVVLEVRQRYRETKDWDRADVLREKLSELGITVEDRAEGPAWRLTK